MLVKIAVATHKGGVGKTTVTLNLAGAFAQMGFKTLCVDCDSQGDLSSLLLDNHESLEWTLANVFTPEGAFTEDLIQETTFENISLIPCDRRLNQVEETTGVRENGNIQALAEALSEVDSDFDVILMDGPPRPHLSHYAAMVAADEVLVPLQASRLSMRSITSLGADLEAMRQTVNPDVGVRYFLSQAKKNRMTEDFYNTLTKVVGPQSVMQARVPDLLSINNAITLGKPMAFHSPNSKAATYVYEFAKEVIEGATSYGQPDKEAA